MSDVQYVRWIIKKRERERQRVRENLHINAPLMKRLEEKRSLFVLYNIEGYSVCFNCTSVTPLTRQLFAQFPIIKGGNNLKYKPGNVMVKREKNHIPLLQKKRHLNPVFYRAPNTSEDRRHA